MKKQTLAACFIAAIALSMYSCDWFGKKEKTAQVSLIGKWKVTLINDTSKHETNGAVPNTFVTTDSLSEVAIFGNDSSLTLTYPNKQLTDTTKYYLDTANQKLYVKNDSLFMSFAIDSFSDSLLRLSANSIHVQLKKQQ